METTRYTITQFIADAKKIVAGDGPTNMMSESRQACANSGFSDRKP